ncbi:Hypothetical predicted protein [Octopus vulgaris]|uniref:Uncharacterized protein n=1 Tax=Octopus vulgaris TaxID=6645 RepID=A0AA36AUX8_OCTVU|nr:Hypothetical predicted protein [Octopus vulgaris]
MKSKGRRGKGEWKGERKGERRGGGGGGEEEEEEEEEALNQLPRGTGCLTGGTDILISFLNLRTAQRQIWDSQ